MQKHIIFLVSFLCLCLNNIQAQQAPKKFPEKKEEFVDDIVKYLNATKSQECEESAKQFKKAVEKGSLTDDDITIIRGVCDKMREKDMNASPFFKKFVDNIVVFSNNPTIYTQYFKSWTSITDKFVADLKKTSINPYDAYLDFSYHFFTKNTLLYIENSHYWRPSATNGQFKYDNGLLKLVYPNTELHGVRKKDSITITQTSGTYYPMEKKWIGDKGRVDWVRTGVKDDIYVNFNKYTVNTLNLEYNVDTALFSQPAVLKTSKPGQFTDKIEVLTATSAATYPRFETFEKILQIDNLSDNLSYQGGFRLEGARIVGFGDEDHKAIIKLYNKDRKLVLKASSKSFNIKRNEQIYSEHAEAIIFFGKDSIYHPNTELRYTADTRILKVTRGNQGTSRTPFFSSMQNMEIFVDGIEWFIDDNIVELGKGRTISEQEVVFESLDYFQERRYFKYQNIGDANAIAKLKIYSEKNGKQMEFPVEQVAKIFGVGVSQIGRLLNDLSEDGFIFYNAEKKTVTLRDKLYHYNNSSIGKQDFDVIRVVSNLKDAQDFGIIKKDSLQKDEKINAQLNIENNELRVNGVRQVVLSDSQKVSIFPKDGKLLLRRNRNMRFNGQVGAGLVLLNGRKMFFDYKKFNMVMDSINWMEINIPKRKRYIDPKTNLTAISIYADEPDDKDVFAIEPINTRIENLKGEMIIDAPYNKSGKEPLPEFPSFDSYEKSHAYYEHPEIQGGAYKKKEFYFELDPFVLDTLLAIEPDNIHFKGRLVSPIFPDVKEVLRIQFNDLSLGFQHQTPPGGYPVYGGRGTYKDVLWLSNKGLLGKGTLDYLGSSTKSEDLVFLPRSMSASADQFNLEEKPINGVEFPKVHGENVRLNWQPFEDKMQINTKGTPFEIFKNGYNLTGELNLTPKGLYGSGMFDWEEATLKSSKILFGRNSLQADTANMTIKAAEAGKIAFNTTNVNAKIDFDAQRGDFSSNTTVINTELPYNKYKTSMDQFSWDMKGQKISLVSSKQPSGMFLSTALDQDSLMFRGTSAEYDLKNSKLNIKGVDGIKTADAVVYPKEGYVEIGQNGEMKLLTDAKIIADTLNRYHIINKAQVQIYGRNGYRADGYYEYNVGSRAQEIRFDNITTDKRSKNSIVTIGSGTISNNTDFWVDKKIKFRGKISLSADSKNLDFEGYNTLDSKSLTNPQWFSVNTRIDRKNVMIDYKTPRSPDGNNLQVGYFLHRGDSLQVYPLVMQHLIEGNDRPIFKAIGRLRHNQLNDRFYLGDSSKVTNPDYFKRGNLLVFDDRDGTIFTEGKLDFNTYFDNIKVDIAGASTLKAKAEQIKFNAMMGLNLYIPEKMMNALIADVFGASVDYPAISYLNNKDFDKLLAEFIIDDKKYEKAITRVKEAEQLVLPKDKELEYTFFIPSMPLVWNPKTGSFVASENICLNTINGKELNKLFTKNIVLEMDINTDSGEILNFYIQTTNFEYFFNYQRGVLQTYSTNPAYMAALMGLKKSETKIKTPGGSSFLLQIAEAGLKDVFMTRMSE